MNDLIQALYDMSADAEISLKILAGRVDLSIRSDVVDIRTSGSDLEKCVRIALRKCDEEADKAVEKLKVRVARSELLQVERKRREAVLLDSSIAAPLDEEK